MTNKNQLNKRLLTSSLPSYRDTQNLITQISDSQINSISSDAIKIQSDLLNTKFVGLSKQMSDTLPNSGILNEPLKVQSSIASLGLIGLGKQMSNTLSNSGILSEPLKVQSSIASLRLIGLSKEISDTLPNYNISNDALKVSTNLAKITMISNDLIKELNLNDRKEAKYLFNQLPTEEYHLETSYFKETNEVSFAIKSNNISEDVIPINELPQVIAVRDIIKDISAQDILNFYRHLVKYPMLGLKHNVGIKIFEGINHELLTVNNLRLYRVRPRKSSERKIPYTDMEMFEAPFGKSGIGRFNVPGHGELYTCDDKKVALDEVLSTDPTYKYDVIEWNLQKELKILDLSESTSPLVQYCSFEKSTPNSQEYILPNFLSQCAKFHDIHGIKYLSVNGQGACNYVFFDFEKRWFNTVELEVDITSPDWYLK